MINNFKKLILPVAALALLALMASCKKQDYIYKDFIVASGLKYPQKADSLKVQGGYMKMLVSWRKSVDPSVVSARIFWNSGRDSLEVDLKGQEQDTVKVLLDNLEEDTYTVSVFTYDKYGNKSVASEATGTIYGPLYVSSCSVRELSSASMVSDGVAMIKWGAKTANLVFTEVRYKSVSGQVKTIRVLPNQSKTIIEDIDNSEPISYRSVFLPKGGLDVAQADWDYEDDTLAFEELAFPKSYWRNAALPSDFYYPIGGNYSWYDMSHLWDGNLHGDSGAWASDFCDRVIWITIDLGYNASITKMMMHHRQYELYGGSAPRNIEVWGSTNPNPDGSWDVSWFLLGELIPFKPSGYLEDGTPGEITAEDSDYWTNRMSFEFDQDISKPARYVRFKFLNNYATFEDPAPVVSTIYVIGEITLFGHFPTLEERNKYVQD